MKKQNTHQINEVFSEFFENKKDFSIVVANLLRLKIKKNENKILILDESERKFKKSRLLFSSKPPVLKSFKGTWKENRFI